MLSKISFRLGRRFLPQSTRRNRFAAERTAQMFAMLAKKELICHAGDVIANDDVPRFRLRKFFIRSGHRARTARVVNEKLFQTPHRAVAVLGDGGIVVDMGEQKALELAISRRFGLAETREAFWGPAYVFHG